MRIGVRAHDYGKHSPLDLAVTLREAGFEAAQLAIPKAIQGIDTFSQITPEVLEDIKISFAKNNIDISVLGCYIEPALLEKTARNEQVGIFLKALEYSKIIGAKLVGTETTHFTYEETKRKEVFELLLDSVLRMIEKAEKIEAVVGIEPVAAHTLDTPELTYQLLEKVKSDKLKIIFDPVNLLTLENIGKQKEVWKVCFEAFGTSIEAVHAKDIILQDNAFKPVVLGEGIVEYTSIFEWLKKHTPDISILREEANPITAHKDISFIKSNIG